METRKDIIGFEGLYQISDHGRVKSLAREKDYGSFKHNKKEIILKNATDGDGYKFVRLFKDGAYHNKKIHRLVGIMFLGLDISNKSLLVCHKDDDPSNNHVNNLFIGNGKDNQQDCIQKGRKNANYGENHRKSKLTDSDIVEIRKLLSEGNTHQSIADKFNVNRSGITKISLGSKHKHQ